MEICQIIYNKKPCIIIKVTLEEMLRKKNKSKRSKK